jgi:carboxymethylenebutenolidase
MSKRDIRIRTSDGEATATAVFPDHTAPAAQQAGVILYMDAFGPRPALVTMAERLALAGYIVLVPDLFYRFGNYGPFDTKTAFSNPASRDQIMAMIRGTTQDMTRRDSAFFISALTQQGAGGRMGVVGYCMGGGRALTAAAAYPDRIAAGASFHGGNLASDAPDSPHLLAGNIKGRVYVGSAGVDQSFPPEQSSRLDEALRRAEIDYVIENYVGMAHGWAVSDHSVFNARGAERHWKRLLTFFEETLQPGQT